ncbi:MAG: protein-export chaperone SecB [Candidatus Marinimicrobia bacterium]|nr:protein-export chaperone SecB [Candidatus Neomarinimicrobiota bacterium]
MSQLKEYQKLISPSQYRHFLENVELSEIQLIDLEASVIPKNLVNKDKVSIRIEDRYTVQSINKKDGEVIISGNLIFDTPIPGRGKNPLIIKAEYSSIFSFKGSIPKEFWELYKEITLPKQIWPYFRELVQSVVSKMNLPSLTLPILK